MAGHQRIKKGRKFKALDAVLGKSTMLASPTVRGKPNSDLIRYYTKRPYYVFAYSSTIRTQTLIHALKDSETEGEAPPIDGVFILDKGLALNLWDGRGALTIFDFESGKPREGWEWIDKPEVTLMWLLLWLHGAMPRFAIRSSPLMAYLFTETRWIPRPPHKSVDEVESA